MGFLEKRKEKKIIGFPDGLVVKDMVLSLLWLRFDPWPENFHMKWAWPKVFLLCFSIFFAIFLFLCLKRPFLCQKKVDTSFRVPRGNKTCT